MGHERYFSSRVDDLHAVHDVLRKYTETTYRRKDSLRVVGTPTAMVHRVLFSFMAVLATNTFHQVLHRTPKGPTGVESANI